MMSGAVWVRDRLEASGWQVEVAHARKVRDVAPLACKTDKVDARVLAELCRRDLVPELWVPSLQDRALRERLRRRAHLVKARTSARNRIFGLLTQFGLRISHSRLRKPDAMALLERRGVPEVWRDSIVEFSSLPQRWIGGSTRSTASWARSQDQTSGRACWRRSRGWAGCSASPSPPRSARSPLSGAWKADRLRGPGASNQPVRRALGDRRALEGRLRTLRWAAVEAANNAWRPANPWHAHYLRVSARHGKNPAKSAVARKLLIAAWHILSRDEPFKPHQPAPANSAAF